MGRLRLFVAATTFGSGVVLGACGPPTFHCSADDDCGDDGTCEASTFCSFPDAACESGQRYGEYAGDIAGKCVREDGTSSGDVDPTIATSISTTLTTSASATLDTTGGDETTPVTVSATDTMATTDTATPVTTETGVASETTDTGPALDPDLVAWYRFENDDAVGVDDTENQLDGTCDDATCPVLVAGVVGSAAQFDGDDDHIRVADADALYTTEAWTVALWLRADTIDPTTLRAAITRAYGSQYNNTYEVYFHDWAGDGPVQLHFGFASLDTENRVAVAGEAPSGQWLHVAGTWDGATGAMYVDGALVGEVVTDESLFDMHDLVLGGDQNNDGPVSSFWPGALDEVRIYGRALDAVEIQTLWASEAP